MPREECIFWKTRQILMTFGLLTPHRNNFPAGIKVCGRSRCTCVWCKLQPSDGLHFPESKRTKRCWADRVLIRPTDKQAARPISCLKAIVFKSFFNQENAQPFGKQNHFKNTSELAQAVSQVKGAAGSVVASVKRNAFVQREKKTTGSRVQI